MRKILLIRNTISSFTYQICLIISGFILPRLILQSYGSEVNGLVNSITQFLAIIAFLELGMGSVIQSALYKPLANKDTQGISEIIASAHKFFRKLGLILFVYVIVLVFIYPYISNQDFGWVYTATLIGAMSISSFAEYYFGIVDRLLLSADQRGYIQYTVKTVTLILNTAACAILIATGYSIHLVKLVTSLFFLLRPAFMIIYVRRNYSIDRKVSYEHEPISQKWNGVSQHVADVILGTTDPIVLTVFATLSDVSIYSVFNLVISGVKQLFLAMSSGVRSLIGELWAKQEIDELHQIFGWVEWTIHTGTTFVFGCVGVLILPFVAVYTQGINDANYIQPLFAAVLTLAHSGHCLRLPYHIMILAGGHYKQTQSNYIIAAVLNIVVSVITVSYLGLIGVAIGTLIAMTYQTIWMALYNSKNLIQWPFKNFIKQVVIDILTIAICALIAGLFEMTAISYLDWIILAIKVSLVMFGVSFAINTIFYREKITMMYSRLKRLRH